MNSRRQIAAQILLSSLFLISSALVANAQFSLPRIDGGNLFNGKLDPTNKNNDLGFHVEMPKFKAPKGSSSGLAVMSYRVDAETGAVSESTRSDKPYQNIGRTAQLKFYSNGKAYWEWSGTSYYASPRLDNPQADQAFARKQSAALSHQQQMIADQNMRQQVANIQQGIAQQSNEQLMASIQPASTPQLYNAIQSTSITIQELRGKNIDASQFIRIEALIQGEINRRNVEAQSFKNVTTIYNSTDINLKYTMRFPGGNPPQQINIPPGGQNYHWDIADSLAMEIQFDGDLSGNDNLVITSLQATRLFSPGEPDPRFGHAYWFVRNGDRLLLSDHPPPSNIGNGPLATPNNNPLNDGKMPQKRTIGVGVQRVDVGAGEIGLQVVNLVPGGVAQQSGIEVNDTIVRVDNVRVTTVDELVQALQRSSGKSVLKVLNFRDGRYLEINIQF
ncbi:MAG: PDZ domain-containing protein [Planctomycetota bacterium]|nr:PDZ domain-containing protein [Planctomycetota bacterium]